MANIRSLPTPAPTLTAPIPRATLTLRPTPRRRLPPAPTPIRPTATRPTLTPTLRRRRRSRRSPRRTSSARPRSLPRTPSRRFRLPRVASPPPASSVVSRGTSMRTGSGPSSRMRDSSLLESASSLTATLESPRGTFKRNYISSSIANIVTALATSSSRMLRPPSRLLLR